jgi:RIO kinase 1
MVTKIGPLAQAYPRGRSFPERDVQNVGSWFVARGLAAEEVRRLTADLIGDARMR